MSAPVRAPRRAAPTHPGRHAPTSPAPSRRPKLRVVPEAPERRRLRPGVLGVFAVVVLFGCLFGLALFQTAIVQGQQRLDDLDGQVQEQQARYEALRLQVAQLESPDRIVADAVGRLGMVPPPGTTYLTPNGAVTTAASGEDVGGTDEPAPDESAADGWSTVKPYLGSTP